MNLIDKFALVAKIKRRIKTIYDIDNNGLKMGEYIALGKLEYWPWFVTKSLPHRKHLFGNLFWKLI